LRPAPAETACYDLATVVDAVAVIIRESSHVVPVADEESTGTVERDVEARAAQIGACGLVDAKPRRQLEAIFDEVGSSADGREASVEDEGVHGGVSAKVQVSRHAS